MAQTKRCLSVSGRRKTTITINDKMKTNYLVLILLLILASVVDAPHAFAGSLARKKSVAKNGERQREYQEAVSALQSQNFLLSFYSFIDKTGAIVSLEPEGNFITVNKDRFMMQKSVSLVLNTFTGADNFKGEISDFKLKKSRNGNVQFSFVLKEGGKALSFKGKMSNGDNAIEGSIKGKKEEREIFLSGNIQTLKSHFVY
jgi:hypothetical protein